MAQFDYTENLNVMTGGENPGHFLLYHLKRSIQYASQIDIIVAFLMESGVKMILDDIRIALDRGARVRILTGNYLGITQPSALYLIRRELGDRVDLRFYDESRRSFHPKAYIFHYGERSEIYIGSSNISKSALTSGIEWNYCLHSERDPESAGSFCDAFEDLFQNHSVMLDDKELEKYSKTWHKPAVFRDFEWYETAGEEKDAELLFLPREIQPRGVQIEALYALEKSRGEGAQRALVQAATGVGKTYLAAFDSAAYERVLFVAHREEILKQAAKAFEHVRKSDDYGFFYGKRKKTGKAVIFASVASLGKAEYLSEKYFPADSFDYIVIDEFHHAVNEQYLRIVDYFKPKFLLGLTATPERMDGRNIFEICDYNVPYEISLKEAIDKGVLVPFHYYGIYDSTDYSGVKRVKGRYDERQLTALYLSGEGSRKRFDLIYRYYKKYPSRRALGFCCSRTHAEVMAAEFCRRGIPAAAVYSNADGVFSEDRERAIERLERQEIRVIFSVDMFNEGLDIASLDMVMFLRPTESPVVFLQQLGRGLRTYRGKEYLNVLDFIGNYEKAGRTPALLRGEREDRPFEETGAYGNGAYGTGATGYPDGCIVDFDMRLIDLFDEMSRRSLTARERIRREYVRVKELLDGRVPSRMEFFTYMEDEIYQYCIRHAKDNPFRGYLEFLKTMGDLTGKEETLCGGTGGEFLNLIETTDMQKVYKIPVLYSFYNGGNVRTEVTDAQVLEVWKAFFDRGTNWKDLGDGMTRESYRAISDRQHLSKAKRMQIHFLKESGKGFFVEREGCALALREDLADVIREEAFVRHMGDILEYRAMEYYRRRYMGM